MPRRILFLSNGHGEDLNGSLILQAILQNYPEVEGAAAPIVGAGNAYRRLNVPIITPTQTMPSGGIFYMNPLHLLRDLWAGLIVLTWQQITSIYRYSQTCDLLFATGDIVPIAMAYLTGRPFCAFIVSTSSYYEGRLQLPLLTEWCLRSSRCHQIFTRDAYTAEDLQQRGFQKALFVGYPIMDVLEPTGTDLYLIPEVAMIALLPGSRLPEACHNLRLQLQLCERLGALRLLQFRAALVPSFHEGILEKVAMEEGWYYEAPGKLSKLISGHEVIVQCYWDAFPDILHQCTLAIGMAGTAVEQAVGLGKPVIQIPGAGPQFTYRFAEAQMRLLGKSVQTMGSEPPSAHILGEIALQIIQTLENFLYLASCPQNGQERVGLAGGSANIAASLMSCLKSKPYNCEKAQLPT